MYESENFTKKPDVKDHILHNLIYIKCPQQANPLGQKVDFIVAWGWEEGEPGMIANEHTVSWLYNLVNTLKTTKLYTLNE